MKKFIKNKKGMTLVELLVSMGIFSVVMTISVSFFISMQKMQMIYRERANLYQEGRITSEIFSRYIREAKKVTVKDGGGNEVTELEASPGICTGGASITLEMLDGNTLEFICGGTPSILSMASCTPSPCTPTNFSYISTDQISIKGLTVFRSDTQTYPKTLRYNIEVEEYKPGVSAGEGEKIMFPGYLVMRNEL